MHMKSIGDQLRKYRACQGRADNAGLAVIETGLSVEQMSDVGRACLDGFFCQVIIRVAVANGYRNAALGSQLADELETAFHFRGNGDQPHNIAVRQDQVSARRNDMLLRLRAFALRINERAFRVTAKNLRAQKFRLTALGHQAAHYVKGSFYLTPADRHRCG